MRTLRYLVTVMALTLSCTQEVSAQGVWTTDTSTAFVARYFAASAVIDSRIYLIGGQDAGIPIQYFDPATHTWNTPAFAGENMDIRQAAACVWHNKIYVFGGWNNTLGIYDTVRIIDPAAQSITRPATHGIFAAREKLTASTVGDKIYVIGGENDDGIDTVAMEMFDPATNTFTIMHPSGPFDPGTGMSATVLSGKIFLIGGLNSDFSRSNELRRFDPTLNTWSILKTNGAFTARAYHGAGILNSRIYIVGGGGPAFPLFMGSDKDTTAEVEIFDPATNAWSRPNYAGIFTARNMLSASVVNNKLYAIGGYQPHQPTDIVEVYTPGPADAVPAEKSSVAATITPNPASSMVTIGVPTAMGDERVEVFDALGRCVDRLEFAEGTRSIRLDVHGYPSGMYSVRIGSVMARFVKE